jgi:hypothetical protein
MEERCNGYWAATILIMIWGQSFMLGISSLVVATLSLVTTRKHERHDLRPIFQLAPFHTYTSKKHVILQT